MKDEKLQCFFWGWGWGAWIVCIFKAGGSWQEKGGGVFEEVGVLIPQCTLWQAIEPKNLIYFSVYTIYTLYIFLHFLFFINSLYTFYILFIFSQKYFSMYISIYLYIFMFVCTLFYIFSYTFCYFYIYIYILFCLFVSLLMCLLDVTLEFFIYIYIISSHTLLHLSHFYFSTFIFVYFYICMFLYFHIFIIVYFQFSCIFAFIFFIFFILIFLWFVCEWLCISVHVIKCVCMWLYVNVCKVSLCACILSYLLFLMRGKGCLLNDQHLISCARVYRVDILWNIL